MQVQKDYVQSSILESAKQEFLEKGFRNASLRMIAKTAKVSLSNIYNYFEDKDAIYCALFEDILEDIEKGKAFIEKMESSEDHSGEAQHLMILDIPIAYVNKNKAMFKLLLFNSEGSSLYGFQHKSGDWFAKLMENTFIELNKKHHLSHTQPSIIFLHILGSMWIHLIEDSLLRDLNEEEIKTNARELMRFVFHGWLGYLGISPH